MARITLDDIRIRSLVEQQLVPLVVAVGSVNAAANELNTALGEVDVNGTVYPNRLHALLSEERGRALNEGSITLVERGLRALEATGRLRTPTPADWKAVAEEILERWRVSREQPDPVRFVADALAVPPAIVRQVLIRNGVFAEDGAGKSPAKPGAVRPAPGDRGTPDWSFQDQAYRRCLDALLKSPDRKVGLIVPTGGGKTRIGLRIVLGALASRSFAKDTAAVLWVTHRHALRRQAHRELQRMTGEGVPDLPPNAPALLSERVHFIMVSQLEEELIARAGHPVLVVIDEAHHAAAPSYGAIFRSSPPVPALFLTATPNRMDRLPIGIDEIGFSITYRELAERGVILRPTFEDFPVQDFEWNEKQIRDLADIVITRAADDYTKTLVIVRRIEQVEIFWRALRDRLLQEPDHPLDPDDLGYVHSRGNSVGVDTDAFLDASAARPRGVLVSAQMLLEGFDDPNINTVVITYPSESVIVLMQAAGRCVRYAEGKRRAFVLQARRDQLAYHFDHRWLYQEISDELRPELRDFEYADTSAWQELVRHQLEVHHIPQVEQERILRSVAELAPGETCRLLFSGLPYYGPASRFAAEAKWTVILETPENSSRLRTLFNRFSADGASTPDPVPFLKHHGPSVGLVAESGPGSEFRRFANLLTAMYWSRRELDRADGVTGRPFVHHGPTTWLRYATFEYRPTVEPALVAFLDDCYNRDETLRSYLQAPAQWVIALKLPLPLGGYEAHLLDPEGAAGLSSLVERIRTALLRVDPADQFAALAAELTRGPGARLPVRLVQRVDRLLVPDEYARLTFQTGSH